MKLQCWTVAASLALGCVPSHAATAEPLAFKPGNPKAKAALARVPEVRSLVEESFAVAFVDLDGDGQMEIVVNSQSSAYCGTGGCATVVLQQQGDRMVVLLNQNLFPVIGVTLEKFGGYRALAALDNNNRILVGEKRGTPMYRKPLIYPMQAKAGTAPSAALPMQKAAANLTTLEQVVRTLAPSMQATGAAPGWPALDRLGIKWHKAGPQQGPAGYTRFGTVKLDGLGPTTVFFIGSRTELSRVSLSLPQDKAVDKSEFDVTVKRLLPAAQIKQVRAGCKDEGVLGGSAVYQVVLPGQRPAYVLMSAGTSKMGLDTMMDIAAQFGKDWNCAP
jgi:hypothetical protein